MGMLSNLNKGKLTTLGIAGLLALGLAVGGWGLFARGPGEDAASPPAEGVGVKRPASDSTIPPLPPGAKLVDEFPPESAAPALKLENPAALSPEQLFDKASPAVVYIVVRDKDFKPLGLGSGFFVSAIPPLPPGFTLDDPAQADANGLIVTNYHVIKGAEFATARLSSGATLFVDGVVAADPDADLALLKVSDGRYPCLKISQGGLPKVGAAVFAIGNPRGLENTFSSGMVSGHRAIKDGVAAIQITAPISPGSSGGPLLNARGEVIGVTTAYLSGGQNLNFAVPVSAVSALMCKQGKVQTLASAGGRRLDNAETEELAKAWAAMHKKDWGTATKILTSLRETQKDNPVVWFALGQLHSRLGNEDIAIQHYKVAIALKPDFFAAYFCMGVAFDALSRYSEAIEAYKKTIALKPDFASAYCSMGDAYDGLKRYSEAIEACKKAIAINPNDAMAYRFMGKGYFRLNRNAEAIEAFKKAIAIDPGDASAYVYMAVVYTRLDRHADALEACKKALAIDPKDAGAYFTMGRAYDGLKRYPEAIEAYKKAIAIDPNNVWSYTNMGKAYEKLDRYGEAIEVYKEALRLEPTGEIADSLRKELARLHPLAGQ